MKNFSSHHNSNRIRNYIKRKREVINWRNLSRKLIRQRKKSRWDKILIETWSWQKVLSFLHKWNYLIKTLNKRNWIKVGLRIKCPYKKKMKIESFGWFMIEMIIHWEMIMKTGKASWTNYLLMLTNYKKSLVKSLLQKEPSSVYQEQ
jgi:hypothetical protein